MKKGLPLFVIMLAMLVMLAGCGNEGTAPAATAAAEAGDAAGDESHAHHHHEPESDTTAAEETPEEEPEPKDTYSLSGSLNDEMKLMVDTDLKLSKENYGKSHQEGEGHVHLYVNGRLIGPLRDEGPHEVVRFLQDGDNEIKLALASNNHNEGAYNTNYSLTVTYEIPAVESAE